MLLLIRFAEVPNKPGLYLLKKKLRNMRASPSLLTLISAEGI